MSLQLIAKQMEAKGRKGDSMLVHMTADEVAGLQKLAESAGGSLTVNPETGLVEANFLKRMLPTLVGAGLMMIPGVGMPLAVAGGALAGGLQAKEDDQDFFKGALMGGLGAYGGASLAGGLTAAAGAPVAGGASTAAAPATSGATVAAPTGAVTHTQALNSFGLNATNTTLPAAQTATTATTTTAPSTFAGNAAKAGEGIGRLADESGRAAFAKEFGFKQAMAGAAPMLMPEDEKVADAPVDDEMYSYTLDPGATGVAATPTASTAERTHLNYRYSPVRKHPASAYPVYAAQGGLMQLAEGGETAPGATDQAMNYLMGDTGASQAGLSYLMGDTNQSPVVQSAMAQQAPVQPVAAPTTTQPADSSRMYTFDPATGTYTKNPNYVDPTVKKDSGLMGGLLSDQQRYDQSYYGPRTNYEGGNAEGGLIGLAKGGMASGGFVIPADVVSMVGEGNTDAGYKRVKAMIPTAKAIKGKDGGQADTVKTSIDGKQPARVAHGEMYIPPATVKRMGGAKKLYAMMDKVRAQATGSTKQIRPVSLKKAMA